MGTGYVRQSSGEFVTGQVINATDSDDEFVALAAAFHASTGHTHDGTTGEGPVVVLTSPGAIGSVAPSTGAFTTLSATSTVSGAGFTARFSTPGPIGNTVASTGAFSTLGTSGLSTLDSLTVTNASTLAAVSASGAVTGAGFTARFSTPGPIGDSSASTGAFTTLAASGTVSGTGFSALLSSPSAIGNVAPGTGAFTTLSATSDVTFNGGTFVFNEAGADKDFRIEGDSDANLILCDASVDRVGIKTATPLAALHVTGDTFFGGNVREKVTISATASTGTINFDVVTQSVLYYTTNASGNFTINVRGDGSTTLNSIMATGDALTIAFLSTQGGTAYYMSAFTVDGSSVTPKYQGGSAFDEGNASGIDSYAITVIKTGDAAFTALAAQTQFG